ncbi:HAD family hydrolase [Gorillibacterium sp. CAU 1737]|uniref:HAD family hydrolase n=1 Tax=Gorillibacterium sp. CAU 1737 TaxID=3140362 RepID=UPI00326162B0
MKYKACIVDLDGTLLCSEKTVSERTCSALLDVHRSGIKIMVATARPPRAVRKLLPEAIHRISSFVYYNGALVVSPELTYSHHHAIEATLSKEVIEFCLLHEPNVDLSLEVEDRWCSLKEYDEEVLKQVRGKPEVISIAELCKMSPSKIILAGTQLAESLIQTYGSSLHILATDRGMLTQISSMQASKENGIKKLCELYGISTEDTICFGDDSNDIGMFQLCGRSVAMGNAIEELKSIATEVTASNDEDGVAFVLEMMLQNNERTQAEG